VKSERLLTGGKRGKAGQGTEAVKSKKLEVKSKSKNRKRGQRKQGPSPLIIDQFQK